MSCTRCGRRTEDPEDWHCDSCNRAYHREQAEDYAAGTPHPVQVGTAFGGPVVIEVHENAQHCGCKGSGWHNTDYDSWHKCPHHDGPHPEYHHRRNPFFYEPNDLRSGAESYLEKCEPSWKTMDEESLIEEASRALYIAYKQGQGEELLDDTTIGVCDKDGLIDWLSHYTGGDAHTMTVTQALRLFRRHGIKRSLHRRNPHGAVEAYREAAMRLFGANRKEAERYIIEPPEWAEEGTLAIIYLEPDFGFPEDNGVIPEALGYFSEEGADNCARLGEEAGIGYIEYQDAGSAAVVGDS